MPHRGNLYQSLIHAATRRLDETGQLPSDMAEFAASAKITPEELHQLFETPDDLHEGLIFHSVTLLNDALRAGAVSSVTDDPVLQLHAIADSYLSWAQQNPTLFRFVVLAMNQPMPEGGALYRFIMAMRDLYHRKLTEAQRRGLLADDADIDMAVLMIHCIVKGGNDIIITRSTDPWFKDDARSDVQLVKQIFRQFIDNLVHIDSKVKKTT